MLCVGAPDPASFRSHLIGFMKLSAQHIRLFRKGYLHGQRGVVFVAGGLTIGVAAAALARLADFVQIHSRAFLGTWPYAALIIVPLGFVASTFLTRRFFPGAQGSGIPQAIAARRLTNQEDRRRLVSLRIALGKILLTLLGLAAGASTGREGPTAQIGASIMFAFGRISARHQPGLILAGASAGVAAAFNTPLAGIVFAIEELSRSFDERTSGLVMGAIIAAGLTSTAILGNYTYFGSSAAALTAVSDWLAIPLIGVIGGALGGLFSRILILFAKGPPGRLARPFGARPLVFAALCGLAVALCGLISGGAIYGTGYEEAHAALHGSENLPPFFGVLKLVSTALSSISGIPGGIFSPSLAVGAGLGSEIASLLPGMPTSSLVLLGMVAYFTGVVQAPITAFVIVSEMTGDHNMLVPLMLTAIIAREVSKLICKEGLYHALAHAFIPRAAEAKPVA